MKTYLLKDKSGFTLIELLIAMLILFIGLIAVAGLVSTAIVGNANAKWSTLATTCAEEKIEELRSIGFAASSGSGACPNIPNFSRTWTVTTDPNIREIRVTVTWQNRRVELATYVAR